MSSAVLHDDDDDMYLPQFALGCATHFSFLYGASHPQEMTRQAAELGWQGIGLSDRGTIAGMVRAHMGAKDADIRLIVGAALPVMMPIEPSQSEAIHSEPAQVQCWLLVYPTSRRGYEDLCRLLSNLNLTQGAHGTSASLASPGDIARLGADQQLIIQCSDPSDADFYQLCQKIKAVANAPLSLGNMLYRDGADDRRLAQTQRLANRLDLPFVALAGALYHIAERRPLGDVLACIREKTHLAAAGWLLSRNAERYLITPQEMARRWRGFDGALRHADRLAASCGFSLDDLAYEYPDEIAPNGRLPDDELAYQTWQGAANRYPDGIPEQVQAYLEKELTLIAKLGYAPYFLTVFDIVRFARSRRILCQGRGSAANSAVCYCLGITAVDPARSEPLFERFVSEARDEPPDIDVDFEHERREEIIQYIYHKYGRHRAGLTATVITYRSRSALVEVAKAFGFSRDVQQALSGEVWGREKARLDEDMLRAAGLDPADDTLKLAMKLVDQLRGFPRHLSQHVGGFVIARERLDHLCAIRPAAMDGRSIIEWDKDDLDVMGLLKIDVLALGMLSCLRRCFDLLGQYYHVPLDLASVPPEDMATYDMLCRGESVGVFQVESRAQMAMLPRLQPRCFHDLVVQVSIVRPGPIQGDMVHPYLRRRAGLEKVDYPSDELRAVLVRTLGVPLFQEQAMKIAIVGAGFSGSEADQLRRAMATFRKNGLIHGFHERMVRGMVARGYDADFATRCFKQIEGFGTYGFPESHAASFALLVYVSAWLKCHYPDVFICGLLNAQPMGFYGPAQLIAEAKRSGVEVRPVDVNHSCWDSTLEATTHARHALRLGFRQIKGLNKSEAGRIAASRVQGYISLPDIIRRADISAQSLEALARGDAFASLGFSRRQALWEIRRLARHKTSDLPLFAHAEKRHASILPRSAIKDGSAAHLPAASLGEEVAEDYQATRFSLKEHPLSLLKAYYGADRWLTCSAAKTAQNGQRLRLIGLVVGRQRPGTAKGTVFVSLEDGQGALNVIVWPKLVTRDRTALLGSHLMGVVGRVQREGQVLHFIADSLHNCDHYLRWMQTNNDTAPMLKSRDFH